MRSPFDPELIEFSGTVVDDPREKAHREAGFLSSEMRIDDGDVTVDVYKVGGGTLGRKYSGLWGYRVARDGKILASGEDLNTGMPKTHMKVALLAVEVVIAKLLSE